MIACTATSKNLRTRLSRGRLYRCQHVRLHYPPESQLEKSIHSLYICACSGWSARDNFVSKRPVSVTHRWKLQIGTSYPRNMYLLLRSKAKQRRESAKHRTLRLRLRYDFLDITKRLQQVQDALFCNYRRLNCRNGMFAALEHQSPRAALLRLSSKVVKAHARAEVLKSLLLTGMPFPQGNTKTKNDHKYYKHGGQSTKKSRKKPTYCAKAELCGF